MSARLSVMPPTLRADKRRAFAVGLWLAPVLWAGVLLVVISTNAIAFAQPSEEFPSRADVVPTLGSPDMERAAAPGEPQAFGDGESPVGTTPTPATQIAPLDAGLDLLQLLVAGGWFMLPIGLFSLIVVMFATERTIALRRSRVIPRRLVAELRQMASTPDHFTPDLALAVTAAYSGSAAVVIRSMLLKTGRPLPEVEAAMRATLDREANRLYANVRWLNLAAAVAPLLGLLGTVWGLITAFHDSTQLAVGDNRAENLAEGIYIALVTTLAGLIVAIAGATVAHLLEGRIQRLFLQIEELALTLLPCLEPFESRGRSRQAPSTGLPRVTSGSPETHGLADRPIGPYSSTESYHQASGRQGRVPIPPPPPEPQAGRPPRTSASS